MSSPAWYPDPYGPPGQNRWYDGAHWSHHTTGGVNPPAPQSRPTQDPSAMQTLRAKAPRQSTWDVLVKLASIRLMVVALIIGVIVAIPLVLVGAPDWLVGPVWIGVAVIVWLLGALNPYNVLYCPASRKRLKGGASACHHCGRHV